MKGTSHTIVTFALGVAGCVSAGSPASRGPRQEAAKSEAVARRVSGDRSGGAWTAASAYQWLTVGKLYWVASPVEADVLVAVLGGGPTPARLTGDVAALNRFLAMQFNGRLPDVGALSDIAQLIKDALVGRRGRIATPEFLDSQALQLDDWLKGDNADPAEFAQLCSGIRTSLDKNAWTVEFNVFNGWGGVDVVRASGTASPLTLQQVSIDVVKPREEFNYPFVD
jgi:hypothetical protein